MVEVEDEHKEGSMVQLAHMMELAHMELARAGQMRAHKTKCVHTRCARENHFIRYLCEH